MAQAIITDDVIRAHLHESGRIAIFWAIDDVQSVRPDLNDEQCMEVLLECARRHDANHGITWTVIETHADWMFPLTNPEPPA